MKITEKNLKIAVSVIATLVKEGVHLLAADEVQSIGRDDVGRHVLRVLTFRPSGCSSGLERI